MWKGQASRECTRCGAATSVRSWQGETSSVEGHGLFDLLISYHLGSNTPGVTLVTGLAVWSPKM